VPDAPLADVLVVAVDGAVHVVELADAAVTGRSTPSVDGSRVTGSVRLDGARGHRLGGGSGTGAAAAVARTHDRLAVALALDGLGAAERALELAVAYAKERVQFDQPIGAFQAVQHLCADMLRDLELGRVAAYFALWAADAGDPAEAHRAATMAKAWASEAFPRIGATAVQVFGGIGFTWEHDIHLFYKRLLTVGSRYGRAAEHYDELARLVII
jgi:alkylation response protein AidB-like acyl-CoA dehydrogenase